MNAQGRTPLETFIRETAAKYGINPDIAMAVVLSEGGQQSLTDPTRQSLVRKNGVQEQSYGPLQLSMAKGALGDLALQAGFDPRDPNQAQGALDFALKYAAQHGWGPWYGWKGDKFAGITQPTMAAQGNPNIVSAPATTTISGVTPAYGQPPIGQTAATTSPSAITAPYGTESRQGTGATGTGTAPQGALPTSTVAKPQPATAQPKDRKTLWDTLMAAGEDFGDAASKYPFKADTSSYPAAARIDAPSTPTIDPSAEAARANRMRMAMLLLNSGRLVG
jgi:hypothetical protein